MMISCGLLPQQTATGETSGSIAVRPKAQRSCYPQARYILGHREYGRTNYGVSRNADHSNVPDVQQPLGRGVIHREWN
jgi:hypothetical protein